VWVVVCTVELLLRYMAARGVWADGLNASRCAASCAVLCCAVLCCRRALASLAAAAEAAGHPEWGYAGPHDSGGYNSLPLDTDFFKPHGGSWDTGGWGCVHTVIV
jgi:hypothetical protein